MHKWGEWGNGESVHGITEILEVIFQRKLNRVTTYEMSALAHPIGSSGGEIVVSIGTLPGSRFVVVVG